MPVRRQQIPLVLTLRHADNRLVVLRILPCSSALLNRSHRLSHHLRHPYQQKSRPNDAYRIIHALQ
jgi:hypothetical protein